MKVLFILITLILFVSELTFAKKHQMLRKNNLRKKMKKAPRSNLQNGAIVTDPTSRRRYKILERLGGGSFGNVYRVSHGREVWALKEMENRNEWAHEVISLRNTIAMKHVLHMHSYFELNEMYYIVMEYFEGGDMENAIINLGFRKRKITVDKTCIALKWIFDVMKGLKEMHDENMAHNDIKAQNIIVEDDTTAVIGDLGLADIFTEKQISDAKASKEILAPGGGTRLYLPPERYLYYPVSAKDMWAFGKTVEEDVLHTWFPESGLRMSHMVRQTLDYSRWHDSMCLRVLAKIPVLAMVELDNRPSDRQMLDFIHEGYDRAQDVKKLFSFMLNHGAVMLSGVSKKASGMFHFRGDRDVFLTPRLDSKVYEDVYGCNTESPFQRNAPYIVWKSQKRRKNIYENYWRCFAVKAAEKNTADGSIMIKTMQDTEYNIRLSGSDCIRGSCTTTIGYKASERADKLFEAISSWISDSKFDADHFWGPLFKDFIKRESKGRIA